MRCSSSHARCADLNGGHFRLLPISRSSVRSMSSAAWCVCMCVCRRERVAWRCRRRRNAARATHTAEATTTAMAAARRFTAMMCVSGHRHGCTASSQGSQVECSSAPDGAPAALLSSCWPRSSMLKSSKVHAMQHSCAWCMQFACSDLVLPSSDLSWTPKKCELPDSPTALWPLRRATYALARRPDSSHAPCGGQSVLRG